MTSNDKTQVQTKPCIFCGKIHTLTVDTKGLNNWIQGVHIQTALPELNPSERELLMTGTCSDCWDKNMKFEDEDE